MNNPNNPSGAPIAQADIRRVAEAAGHALVFVDEEAYCHFMGENFLEEAQAYPNGTVGRTFSKALRAWPACASAPMIAPAAVLEPIRQAMPLFNLNVVAVSSAARGADGHGAPALVFDQVAQSKALVHETCDRLACGTGRAVRTSC